MRKRYSTNKYVLQVVLSAVEGIKIDGIERIGEGECRRLNITFSFPINKGVEVHELIEAFKRRDEIEDFEGKKALRKQLLDEYHDSNKCDIDA